MKFPISQRHASLRGSALEPEKHWPFLVLVTWSRGESLPATNGRKTDTRVDFGESLAPAAAAAARISERTTATARRTASVYAASVGASKSAVCSRASSTNASAAGVRGGARGRA